MYALIRTWKRFDIEKISKHLLLVGQLSADCGNCKAIGIDYLASKSCPECNTEFKFIATRQNQGKFPASLIKRIQEKQPNLQFIDYSDFKLSFERNKAKEFFK